MEANSCVKMTPHARWHSCVLMLHSFTTRAWWILALLSWNMPKPSGKKKSNWWDNLAFSTFRNSADLQSLDLTNWSNPRSLQFADVNRNDNFFLDGQCISLPIKTFLNVSAILLKCQVQFFPPAGIVWIQKFAIQTRKISLTFKSLTAAGYEIAVHGLGKELKPRFYPAELNQNSLLGLQWKAVINEPWI